MPTNLRQVRSFAHLVRYLEDELGWPLEGCKMSEITFDYDPEDLGLMKWTHRIGQLGRES